MLLVNVKLAKASLAAEANRLDFFMNLFLMLYHVFVEFVERATLLNQLLIHGLIVAAPLLILGGNGLLEVPQALFGDLGCAVAIDEFVRLERA